MVGVDARELPALPDAIAEDPRAGVVEPRAWFDEPGLPFEIEIGSGKGTFLVQQAMLQPGVNFLGIEWAREFYLYAADRVRRRRERGLLANVRLLNADATSFVRWRVPDGIVRVVHLYFSDPWPKTRHHKKRVVQDRFMGDVWRVLEPGGELRVVTDHDELWDWDLAHFARWTGARGWELLRGYGSVERAGGGGPFEMLPFDRPESAGHGELVGTNFERKFRRAGSGFHAAVLRKRV
ncbi:MAG TPA: hypothetical protein VFF69_07375 [Phycisphaerales bacterium]|nr:hypothetical protein [Phycisphaerales bacterium]